MITDEQLELIYPEVHSYYRRLFLGISIYYNRLQYERLK